MSDDAFDLEAPATKLAKAGPSLKARAVRYLSVREHTRQELYRKLLPHAKDEDALHTVLNELEKQGWQSDARFVQTFESSRLHRYGARRIASSMRERGVDVALIQDSVARLKESEPQRAWDIWNRRFGQSGLPVDQKEYARQARFLASRGFDAQVVSQVLTGRYSPEELD